MPDEHPELDLLRTALWDRSELSSPIVFRSGTEPPEHVRKLMDTLGVRVEVGPVSGRPMAHARELENGFAAQDFRKSVARVFRREQAGDTAVTCEGCGTETDVTAVAHRPGCDRRVAPVPAAEPERKTMTWEKGRNGQRRSTSTHMADGSITAGEQHRRHEVYLDEIATVTSCGLDGCGWRFEGTALAGREASAAHRAEAHPDLTVGKRRQQLKPGQGIAQVHAEPQERTPGVDIPAAEIATNGSTEPRQEDREMDTGRKIWTRDEILAAIKTWADAHGGAPPSSSDWMKGQAGFPTTSTVIKYCGKWSTAIADAGFAKPKHGGQSGNNTGSARSTPAPAVITAPKPREAPPVPLNGETTFPELLAAFGKAQQEADAALERLSTLSSQVKAHPLFERARDAGWL